MVFPNLTTERIVDAFLAFILCFIWMQSFGKVTGPILGSPDFELAVCLAALLFLLYIGTKVILSVKKSSIIDVLIDDFIYNGISKEIVYKHLIIDRMGFSVLEICAHELHVLKNSAESLQEHKQNIGNLDAILTDGSIDIHHMQDYIDIIKSANSLSICLDKAEELLDKLDQILNLDIGLANDLEYQYVSSELNRIIKELQSFMKLSDTVEKKLRNWWQVFHCDKRGGWCVEECPHRHDRKI